MAQYTPSQKDKIRSFLITLNVNEGIAEILVPEMSYTPLASLFTQKEINGMWASSEDKANELTKTAFDLSHSTNYSDISDMTWDIIHSYDPIHLQKAIRHYIEAKPLRPESRKRDVIELNMNWELPIPVHNTIMKLPQSANRDILFIYVAKAEESTSSKSYKAALDLLNEALKILNTLNNRDTVRLLKMISWLILVTEIQQRLDQLPCVEESVMAALTTEAKQCLTQLNGREGVVPWSNVINWCLLLLVNVQDWSSILNGFPLPQHIPLLTMVKPLSATAQSLQDKNTNKKIWYELWDAVLSIVVGGNNLPPHKSRSQSMDRHHDGNGDGAMTRANFLDFVSNIKEASCLSIFMSLLGHFLNILTDEPSCDVHIDHLAMWPSNVGIKSGHEAVKDTLAFLVNHATKLYPSPTHTSVSLCTSWHLTKADLAYLNEEYQSAMQGYLTAIFVATDYLRNDATADQFISGDLITKRMVRCCMNLNCYTQVSKLYLIILNFIIEIKLL